MTKNRPKPSIWSIRSIFIRLESIIDLKLKTLQYTLKGI